MRIFLSFCAFLLATSCSMLFQKQDLDNALDRSSEAISTFTVSGQVTLPAGGPSDCEPSLVEVVFHNIESDDLIGPTDVLLTPELDFNIEEVPSGTYDIFFKGKFKYPRVSITNLNVTSDVSSLNPIFTATGDIDGDNDVDIDDYNNEMQPAFLSLEGDANFNAYADLNCDGIINTFDYSILNFFSGSIGEDLP